jgi:hypothetical protein
MTPLPHSSSSTSSTLSYYKATSPSTGTRTSPQKASPSISGTAAEIFLHCIENQHIKHLLESNTLAYYTRYVNDILLIYDSSKTNPHYIQQHILTLHKNIRLNTTEETKNRVHFLDLTITREPNHLDIDIYRKPTMTDTTINFHSNHTPSPEQKLAAYRFLIQRMLTLPSSKTKKNGITY